MANRRLGSFFGRSRDADLLRKMIGFATARPMQLEVESLTGAAYVQRLSIHRIVESHFHLEVDNFHAAGRCSLTVGAPAPYLRSTMVPRRMDSRGLIGNTVRTTQKGPKPWLPPQL